MPQKIKSALKPLKFGQEAIPQRIRRIRKERGLTQTELAEKIGISRDLEAAYESGRSRLFDEMVARFAVALGVSSDEILGLKNLADAENLKSVRFSRRLRELESLPESKKKAVLKILDELIRANA